MTAQTATEPQPKSSSRLVRTVARARGLPPVWGLNVAVIAAGWCCCSTGAVNLNLATWNRASGALRADYTSWSYTCRTCGTTGSGTVNSNLATWGLASVVTPARGG